MCPCVHGPDAGPGLNALTFDKAGNVYVSDSFNSVIWRTGKNGGPPTQWSSDALLGPGNGSYTALRRQWHRVQQCRHDPVRGQHRVSSDHPDPGEADGTAGTPSIFITGINAPDGIAIDRDDNLWVCANQEDEIVVIDTTGKVIAKLGDFNGIDPKGFARGLTVPGEPGLQQRPLDPLRLEFDAVPAECTGGAGQAAINSAWTLEVSGSTVSKLRAKIPPFSGDNEQ